MPFFNDIYTQALREQTLPHAPGCPDLDAMVLLNLARKNPGLRKGDLAYAAQEATNSPDSDQEELRRSLRNIDCLVWLKYLAIYNHAYHITPPGLKRLEELKAQTHSAMMDLAMGY